MKRKLIQENIQYDYFVKPSSNMQFIQLTYTGKKPEVVLISHSMETFMDMGDRDFLKGQAYVDYLKLKERNMNA